MKGIGLKTQGASQSKEAERERDRLARAAWIQSSAFLQTWGRSPMSVVGGGVSARQMSVQGICSALLQSSRRSKANFDTICAYEQDMGSMRGMWNKRGSLYGPPKKCLCVPGRVLPGLTGMISACYCFVCYLFSLFVLTCEAPFPSNMQHESCCPLRFVERENGDSLVNRDVSWYQNRDDPGPPTTAFTRLYNTGVESGIAFSRNPS